MPEITINLTATVPLKPFNPPNYVLAAKKEGFIEKDHSFPLSDVSAQALSALCDDWRAAVFKKAGKTDPRLED